jgi:hypothetical protein
MTLAGIIVGNPLTATEEKSVAFTEVSRNFLLVIVCFLVFCIVLGLY